MQVTKKPFRKGIRVPFSISLIAVFSVFFTACNSETNVSEPKPERTGQYTLQQQVFCLNALSNISASFNGKGNIQDSTTAAINTVLANDSVQQYIGSWQTIWGPVVNVNNDTAVNTMFIAQKTGTDTFVIAIAGTDPSSVFDWIFEDLNVIPLPWDPHLDPKKPKKGYVTTATLTGFTALNTMISNDSLAWQVITSRAKSISGMQIWVTGHSLGGALSPAYALYLRDNLTTWAPGTNAVVNCLAVAGATPGDSTFNAYYKQQMGPTTTRVWNTRDMVPHGFEVDMLREVPGLYGDSVAAFPKDLNGPLNFIINKVKPLNYTQFHPADSFTSAIYTADSLPKLSPPDSSFMKQEVCQHIPSYGVYFGIFGFQKAVQNALGLAAPYFTESAVLVPVYNTGVGQ